MQGRAPVGGGAFGKSRDKAIHQLNQLSLDELAGFFTHLQLDNMQQAIAVVSCREISARINFLVNVGLDYLSLGRSGNTLSGGESQRIRLASQVGSGPYRRYLCVGRTVHRFTSHDNSRLLETLMRLRDLHNTVIVVEHDEEAIVKPIMSWIWAGRRCCRRSSVVAVNPKNHPPQSLFDRTLLIGKKSIARPKHRRQSVKTAPLL